MPKWKSLKRFLDKRARFLREDGRHYLYIFTRHDGLEIRVPCSKSSKEISYGKWQYILKHELKITQEEFNEGLK